MDNNEEKKIEDVTSPPDQFVGRDLLESYMVEYNHKPSNPLDRYNTLINAITFGMELLPDYDNPDEKDEEQIKKNKEKQDNKDILYNKACAALKTEIVNRREIKYDHLIKDHRVYILTADDAGDCEALENELEIVKNDFITQQHEQHISKLQEVHNQIFHVLTKGDNPVIKPVDPSFDTMKNEFKKTFLSDIMEDKKDGLQ